MIESYDGRIRIWPRAFTPAECDALVARFEWGKHGVVHNPELAIELGAMCAARMDFPVRWVPHVTFSCEFVPWHTDRSIEGETHKACLYLDADGIGTEFAVSGESVYVPVRQGTLVLFDIALEHRTGPGEGRRHVLGLRACIDPPLP